MPDQATNLTLDYLRAVTPDELAKRINCLADDAGAFSVPQVRAIVTKLLARVANEKDRQYGTP